MKMILIVSVLSIINWRKNLMFILISLELIPLALFNLMMNTNNLSNEFIMLMLLTIMVSTATMSLAMMVAISRNNKSIMTQHLWPNTK